MRHQSRCHPTSKSMSCDIVAPDTPPRNDASSQRHMQSSRSDAGDWPQGQLHICRVPRRRGVEQRQAAPSRAHATGEPAPPYNPAHHHHGQHEQQQEAVAGRHDSRWPRRFTMDMNSCRVRSSLRNSPRSTLVSIDDDSCSTPRTTIQGARRTSRRQCPAARGWRRSCPPRRAPDAPATAVAACVPPRCAGSSTPDDHLLRDVADDEPAEEWQDVVRAERLVCPADDHRFWQFSSAREQALRKSVVSFLTSV
jgi:hypothetical protein